MFKIAVLISGGGSNLQSIIDHISSGYLNCEIKCVIADREGIYGIERAKENNIEVFIIDRKVYKQRISDEILKIIKGKVDLVVLAGWLSILKGDLIKEFENKIINIHPSLIPSFCGDGMYGIKVHENVLQYGVKVTGCTVHFVDQGTDSGPIIIQRTAEVFNTDDAKSLQQRVLIEEHKALPDAIKLILDGKIKIIDRKVFIQE